jgi:hypothetical protein
VLNSDTVAWRIEEKNKNTPYSIGKNSAHSFDENDCICPKKDNKDNLYYIKRKNEQYERTYHTVRRIIKKPITCLIEWIDGILPSNGNAHRAEYRFSNGAVKKNGKMWVNNELLNIKKIAKKNRRYSDLGSVPSDWKLIKYSNGEETVLAYGVADYDIVEENGKTIIVYTNGKKVYKLWEENDEVEKEKLFNTTRCMRVCANRG